MNIGEYGALGESLARRFLVKAGYKILTANYQKRVGEADIVALETKRTRKKRPEYKNMSKLIRNENVLVFVEVKSRMSTKFGRPSDAVDNKKRKHYESLARTFKMLNPKFGGLPIRFDIIEVVGERVENHMLGAF